MIIELQGGSAPEKWVGYLALRYDEETDAWVPLDGQLMPSLDQAIHRCQAHLRTQIDDLRSDIDRNLERITRNLGRMMDTPRPPDRLDIDVMVWRLDENGALSVLQQPVKKKHAGPPRRALYGLVDDDVFDILSHAIDLPEDRDGALGLMIDVARDAPHELLAKVAEVMPGELGTIAEFMVQLYRATTPADEDTE